ncbi:MAG: hypothetical protein EPN47_13550 [Acidobacteria bacterium]|nr:MAG: hypothetical protein EPN47_13550 [Acidobacteriota bacterium]
MKIFVFALLGLILGPPFAFSAESTQKSREPTEKSEAAPLTRATEEFKLLTGKWGMRPGSPPSARRNFGPKMLWHGRIYEYFRNDSLDAIPHEVNQNRGTKSPLHRNQFGFNVAGPFLIPRLINNPQNTFFTLSYEGVRETISRASLHTIPTAAQRNGDFSKTVDQAGHPLIIYDLLTTASNPTYDISRPVSTSNLQYLRSPFPGNIIPSNRLAPDVQQALSYYPLPNTNVGPFFENNYFVNAPQYDTADGIIARVDQSLGTRHRLSFQTAISNGFVSAPKYFPNLASPTSPDQNYSRWRAEISYVFTATSKTVDSVHLTAESEVAKAGSGEQTPFPVYQLVNNYLSMGTGYPNSHNARNTLEIQNSVSTQQGKHSLQLTFQADKYQLNSYTPQYPVGYFQFSTGLTSLPGIVNTGDSFASFLLGLPRYAERTVITSPSYFRNSYQSVTGGDKYQISKTLTMSLDLAFERHTPRVEKYNRQSTIDPLVLDPATGLLGALVFAGRDGIPRGLRPSSAKLDYTLGLVWNPGGDSKTGVHASFRHWHGHMPIYDGQWGTQGFNARQTFTSANGQLSPAIKMENGIPPMPTPLPDLSPSAADNTVADYVDMTSRVPVYRAASLSVERQVPFSMVVTLGTDYSAGRDLLVGDEATTPNAINPSYLRYRDRLNDEAFRLTLQPYPQFKAFELYGLYPAGRYQRKSGYVQVEKRESYGLSFSATYELSSQFDNYSGPYGNQDLINLSNDWAATAYNTPQSLQFSYNYDLPFGTGKPLLGFVGWGRPIVSGWSVSGMAYWNGGWPLALHPQFNNTGDVLPTLFVDVVPGVDPHVASPGPSQWFNPSAFAQPADFTLGDGPRTVSDLLGPGSNRIDVSVDKRMPVGGTSVDFNLTAFNFLNHANWNYPDTTIGPASAPNIDAGRIIGSHGGRVIQLGLILSF